MELKPCPFCGGEIRIARLHGSYGEPWYARCDRCEVSSYYYRTEAQAIEAWSDRAERTCHRMTADDVRRLIERYSDDGGGNWRDFHNGAYVAIADELNTRAERTCEWCADGRFDGQAVMMSNHGWQRINYCPNCGAKVVEE